MAFITSKQENGQDVQIYYEDLGQGKPVVFIHGWPLNSKMWEYQVTELTNHGYRCIIYDRRGFGKSDRPGGPYDYDALASDLKAVIDGLGLNDVTVVGFSMGGGEVARYFGNYGGDHVSKVVLVSAVTPYMLKTDNNPDGVPKEAFDEMTEGMRKDRPAFMEGFNKEFFGVNFLKHPVSEAFLSAALVQQVDASPIATLECAKAFAFTDFRRDVPKINVPTLIIHGSGDKIVPIEISSEKAEQLIPGATLKVYEGAPHGLWMTHKDELNKDLMEFI